MHTSFRFIRPALLLALLIGALSNCTYEQLSPDTGVSTSGICFETDILPIFQTNCTQSKCHNAKDRKEGFDLTNYAGIMRGIFPGNYQRSRIYESLVDNGDDIMPPPPYNPLDKASISLISQWIQEGAPNSTNCSTPVNNCDLSTVTYAKVVAPLMQKYCNGCHSGTAPQGNIQTATYTALKALSAKSSFMGSIRHLSGFSPMPQNAAKLSNCQIDQIEKWIQLGAKND